MAKYKSDFTITVLSESLYQYDNSTQAPASLGPFGPINLRRKCVPYIAGSLTALDREIRYDCFDSSSTYTLSFLTPGGQTYAPALTFDIYSTLALITPGGQLYDPAISLQFNVSMLLQTPGGQLYEPTISPQFNVSMLLQTPGGQLYNPTISSPLDISMLLQTPGGQLYNPTINTTNVQILSFLTPGAQLYNPTISSPLDVSMLLQTPGGQLYNPTIDDSITQTVSFLTPGAQLYNPCSACGGCVVTKSLSGSSRDGDANHLDLGTTIDYKNNITDSPNGYTMAFWLYPTYQPGYNATRLSSSIIYMRGWDDLGYPTDLSLELFVEPQASNQINWVAYNGGYTWGFTTGRWNTWNLYVFQASASGGNLIPRHTVVYPIAGTTIQTHNTAADLPDFFVGDGPTNVKSYIGALSMSSGLSNDRGGFAGKIGDAAMWNKTLSLEEITGTLYNGGKPLCLKTSTLSTDLQHWWRMGNGAGDTSGNGGTIFDQTGSADATIVGGSDFDIVDLSCFGDSIYCDGEG